MTDINREEVHARIEASEARVATVLTDMRADLKTGLSEMRADMETELSEMRADMKTGLSEMRANMETGLSEMRANIEKMRADIHQMFTAQTKWIVVIVFGALAAAGTIFNIVKPISPVPSAQSAPFVIYAQPYPAQAPPAIASDIRP